jgi:peptidoglycan/LPS O-acetylase OafA/YrhL
LLHERVGDFVLYQTGRLGLRERGSLLIALLSIGIVSLLISMYCEPALRKVLKKIGGMLNPAAKKPVFEAP